MRIAVTGGRDYSNVVKVFTTLEILLYKNSIITLVVGDSKGADSHATVWAQKKNIPCEIYRADWNYYGRSAGPIRNKKMLESGIDLLVAFPGGAGTANMTRLCEQHHVKILRVRDEEG
jgi:hypothetical protein